MEEQPAFSWGEHCSVDKANACTKQNAFSENQTRNAFHKSQTPQKNQRGTRVQ